MIEYNRISVDLSANGSAVTVQNPLPCDGDSVYEKDVDVARSSSAGWTGDLTDLFGDLELGLTRADGANPKNITVYFERTVVTNACGFGANTGNFSNLKLIALLSGGGEFTLYDGSTDATVRTSQTIQFIPIGFVGLRVEFHTANAVTVTNFAIIKGILSISSLQGIDPDGNTVNIGATVDGNLKVTNAESGLAIAEGDVTGKTFIHKFGQAPDFDITDTFVTVWDGANDARGAQQLMDYVFSTSADIEEMASTNGADTQEIEIQGLDANYELVTQTKALTGQAPVTLDTPLIRVFRLKNIGNTDLAGDVTVATNNAVWSGGQVTAGTASEQRAIINNGNNQTLMAVYTVPAGKTGYMRDWYAAQSNETGGFFGTDGSCTIKLKARPFGEVFQLKHISSIKSNGTGAYQHRYTEPEVFEEKTDIIMESNTSVDAAAVAAGFDIVLVDN